VRFRLGLLVGLMAATMMTIQGCDAGVSGNHDSSSGCADRSYDLTRPPTRDDLEMTPGKSVLDVSCDDGFKVSLTLPDDATTTITARRLNADSYASGNPETGDPTTVDVHSVSYDLDQAVKATGSIAADLGIDPAPLQRWRRDVESNPNSSVDSPFMRSKLDYLTAELQVQHLATSGNNYVHLVLSWD